MHYHSDLLFCLTCTNVKAAVTKDMQQRQPMPLYTHSCREVEPMGMAGCADCAFVTLTRPMQPSNICPVMHCLKHDAS
jgi:hypothetical protein